MIKAVVFDIGGIFELEPLGRDPTARFPEMIADWERRLHLQTGELRTHLTAVRYPIAEARGVCKHAWI